MEKYIESLEYHKDLWRIYLRATTAISGAGATYGIGVYIIRVITHSQGTKVHP